MKTPKDNKLKEEGNHSGFSVKSTLKFASVDDMGHQAFRNNSLIPQREIDPKRISKVLTHFSALTNIVLGSVLDVAESYVVETDSALRKLGMMKGEVKYRMRIAKDEKFYKAKYTLLENTKNRKDLYIDLLEKVNDEIAEHMNKLYYSVLQVLTKHNVENAKMKSTMEVAWFTQYLACKVFDGIVSGSQSLSGIETKAFFARADPHDAFGAWEKLCDTVCDYDEATRNDLTNDSNIKLGFDIVLSNLLDPDRIDARCEEILAEHPEFDRRRNEVECERQRVQIEDAAKSVLEKNGGAVKKIKVRV